MLKKVIKRIIGQSRITAVKQRVKYIKDVRYLHSNPNIVIKDGTWMYQKFSQSGRHVFFGYYDISQFDCDEKRLLVHSVDKGADAHKDKAELGYYKVDSCEYVPIATTHAWCWQQGARLRWHPYERNTVLYNDVEDGSYVTRLYDLSERKVLRTFCDAFYDVASDFAYGLSLNFSRLQRLRPGYGYSVLPDDTARSTAPDDDGIYYVDIQSDEKKLLISLADLAPCVDDPCADQHYINHISIAPDGKKFMFFHIWTLKGDTHWRTRLCVYSFETKQLVVLEDKDRVSHYDWKNDNELLVTCWDENREQYYCIYDIAKKQKKILRNRHLNHDGHPSVCGDERYFVSDTYPLAHGMQTVFKYDFKEDVYTPLVRLYSDARLYDEKRCDLHPRVSKSERFVTIDTTYEGGCRQIILMKGGEL